MSKLTRNQAVEFGFTIDDGQRPLAYKGPRFSPTHREEVMTEIEEELVEVLEDLIYGTPIGNRRNRNDDGLTDFRGGYDFEKRVEAARAAIAKAKG